MVEVFCLDSGPTEAQASAKLPVRWCPLAFSKPEKVVPLRWCPLAFSCCFMFKKLVGTV